MLKHRLGILFLSIFNVCLFDIIKGDDDFQAKCDMIDCSADELCIMKTVDCVSDPCPKLPTCIDSSSVCKGSQPLINTTGGVVTCTSSCPPLHKCIEGVCCFTTDATPLTVDKIIKNVVEPVVKGDGKTPPFFLNPELFWKDHTDESKEAPCIPCGISLCFTAVCKKPKGIRCRQDGCSCAIWFADSDGNQVACLESGTSSDPILLPPMDGTPTLKPSEIPVATLESQDTEPEPNGSWRYPVSAVCGAIAICAFAFVIYKVVKRRQMHKQEASNIEEVQEEQKVALKEVMSSENNNHTKQSKQPLVSSSSTTENVP